MTKTKTLLAALALCTLGASAASADVVRDHRQLTTVVRDHRQPQANTKSERNRYDKKEQKKSERANKRNERADKRNERADRDQHGNAYGRDHGIPAPDMQRPNIRVPSKPAVVRYAPVIDTVDSTASWYGTIITVSGSNLPSHVQIRLDNRTVSPLYESSQRIIFIAPPTRAQTANLTLVAPAGSLDLGSVTLLTRRTPARIFGSVGMKAEWRWSS